MRRLIKSVVSDIVDEVVECEYGIDALRAYTNFQPDWVFMDIKMPRVDRLIATISIIKAFPDANICIVTDYRDKRTEDATRAAGVKRYVLKDNLFSLRQILKDG